MRKDEMIFTDLKKKILGVEIMPGTKLSENILSKEYNISRTPIRKVLQQLEGEGLVDIIPQTGSFVTKIAISRIFDVVFLRKCVEPEIFRLLINLDSEQFDDLVIDLENVVKDQEKLTEEDSVEFARLDNLFHYVMFKHADKLDIYKLIETHSVHYNRLRVLFLALYDIESKVKEHKIIIQQLKDKDIEGFKGLLVEHMKPLSEKMALGEYDAMREYIKE